MFYRDSPLPPSWHPVAREQMSRGIRQLTEDVRDQAVSPRSSFTHVGRAVRGATVAHGRACARQHPRSARHGPVALSLPRSATEVSRAKYRER